MKYKKDIMQKLRDIDIKCFSIIKENCCCIVKENAVSHIRNNVFRNVENIFLMRVLTSSYFCSEKDFENAYKLLETI